VRGGGFDTRCVGGDAGAVEEADHAPALHVATTYALPRDEKVAGKSVTGNEFVYARAAAPTRTRLETAFGVVEGGQCVSFSSGMAAISSVFAAVAPALVLLVNVGYTGTHSFLRQHENVYKQTESMEEFCKQAAALDGKQQRCM